MLDNDAPDGDNPSEGRDHCSDSISQELNPSCKPKVSISPAPLPPDCSDPYVYATHGQCPWQPNPPFPPINWEAVREFTGTIDPFEAGPLSGTGLSFTGAAQDITASYIANCVPCQGYPAIENAAILSLKIAEYGATAFDYGYDQHWNTGPYSSLPGPRDLPAAWYGLNTHQKIIVSAYIVVIAGVVIVIAAP
jgi:hypothetical protein